MTYNELYQHLRTAHEGEQDEQVIPMLHVKLLRFKFYSRGVPFLPGAHSYNCTEHGINFNGHEDGTGHSGSPERSLLDTHDSAINCNEIFHYLMLQPTEEVASRGVILLFHGLNEKSWDKYLPWAYQLMKLTGKSVILFPIAFHMNRSPEAWSNAKLMQQVAHIRAQHHQHNSHISFVNAAISTRLEENPQRLFWSGLQTYKDVADLLLQIKDGKHAHIAADATVDLFGYSIGAFFSIILLMANPHMMLSRSKLFLFCGGTTLDRMYPASRYILDTRSSVALQSYFAEQMNNDFRGERRLAHYLSDAHGEESSFKTMLQYNHYKEAREQRLATLSDRIYAIPLKQDSIIPPVEVINLLQGDFRNIPIPVEIMDFKYPYAHVNPFPLGRKHHGLVDAAFHEVMQKAANFFG